MKRGMYGDLYDFQAGDEIVDFRGITRAIVKEFDQNPGVLYLEFLDKTGLELYVGEPGEIADTALRAVANTLRCVW